MSSAHDEARGDATPRRVLIEGSKLADATMDGIKRYVTGLLRGLRADGRDGLEFDVLIESQIHPLRTIPRSWLEEKGRTAASPPPAGMPSRGPQSARDWLLHLVGICLPPASLRPLRAVIPERVAPLLFGKERSELVVPARDSFRNGPLSRWVPPAVAHAAQKWLPPRAVLWLWRRGAFEIPARVNDLGAYDLVHVTLPNNVPYLPRSAVPILVTIHDLSHIDCPQYQSRENCVTLGLGMECAVRDGATFVADSEATRRRAIDAYALDPARISTVHLGCDPRWLDAPVDAAAEERVRTKYGIPPGRFLLTLGTLEPRKNLARTIDAFVLAFGGHAPADVALVVAGAGGWKTGALDRTMAARPVRVVRTGYVDDDDLPALYAAATAFVYVSHYEGFGLPLVEAMSCGTPVLYGDNSSMPEIVGDAGLAADAGDTDSIARQMRRLVDDEALATRLGRAGRERARSLSEAATVERTRALYRAHLAGGPSRGPEQES